MYKSIFIEDVEFNNGDKIKFSKNDIVVFIGANNSGKSRTLKELALKLRNKIGMKNLDINNIFNNKINL